MRSQPQHSGSPKRQPSAWERRWIRWAKQEMQRREKQLLRETQEGPSRTPAPAEKTAGG